MNRVWHVGVLFGLMTVLSTETGWARPDDSVTDTLSSPGEKPAAVQEGFTGCGTSIQSGFQLRSSEQRRPVNDLIVAEDMRCRQCHGKCSADSLRCRSQCASDGSCLVHCEERTRNCESLCKQVFQCQ